MIENIMNLVQEKTSNRIKNLVIKKIVLFEQILKKDKNF